MQLNSEDVIWAVLHWTLCPAVIILGLKDESENNFGISF